MNSKGFTIIELMIVIAIIGILAALVAPYFGAKYQGGYDGLHQGTVVQQVTQPSYTCVNGVLVDGQGQPFVRDGATVTCK